MEGRPPGERQTWPGFEPRGTFSRFSHTSDFNIGSPVSSVIVSMLELVGSASAQWLGEIAGLIPSFCLSVAARTAV